MTHSNKGNALGRLGRDEEALAAVEEAIHLIQRMPVFTTIKDVRLLGLGAMRRQ